MPTYYAFRGNKDYTVAQVGEMLGLGAAPAAPAGVTNGGEAPRAKFLTPLSDCESQLTSVLEELQRDPWSVSSGQRPTRSTGVALSIAVSLLEAKFKHSGGRIMLFTGGPCTQGPGQVASRELKEVMRSHSDIAAGININYVKSASKFYDALSVRASANGHAIDIFSCALDQMGLLEMRQLVARTGGTTVNAETFSDKIFNESFAQAFATETRRDPVSGQNVETMNMAFNAHIEVQTSREFRVAGCIGPVISLKKKSPCVSDTPVGIGLTSAWKVCGITPDTTLGFYFDLPPSQTTPVAAGSRGLTQYLTQYQHSSGQFRLRVTTVAHGWADSGPGGQEAIGGSFDQEAAAVLMARLSVFRSMSESSFDILRWLDRQLIRVVSKFGSYRKDDPNSFQLAPHFGLYPQFMFYLRRSPFLQVFNCSPDETSYYRNLLLKADVTSSLVMIQPTLYVYSFDGPPRPALLDATSMQPNVILLLDTFFHVVVWHGETIDQWKKAGYHQQDEHAAFKALLEAPLEDVKTTVKGRIPVPRLVETQKGGSQARFLVAKLNPSITHNNSGHAGQEVIFTDDVSLQVFMDHLKRLAVQTEK